MQHEHDLHQLQRNKARAPPDNRDLWGDAQEQLLVEFYSRNPPLWDPRDLDYKKLSVSSSLLGELQELLQKNFGLHYPLPELKRKFTNMRTQFWRELKRHGPSILQRSPWRHTRGMQFLLVVAREEGRIDAGAVVAEEGAFEYADNSMDDDQPIDGIRLQQFMEEMRGGDAAGVITVDGGDEYGGACEVKYNPKTDDHEMSCPRMTEEQQLTCPRMPEEHQLACPRVSEEPANSPSLCNTTTGPSSSAYTPVPAPPRIRTTRCTRCLCTQVSEQDALWAQLTVGELAQLTPMQKDLAKIEIQSVILRLKHGLQQQSDSGN